MATAYASTKSDIARPFRVDQRNATAAVATAVASWGQGRSGHDPHGDWLAARNKLFQELNPGNAFSSDVAREGAIDRLNQLDDLIFETPASSAQGAACKLLLAVLHSAEGAGLVAGLARTIAGEAGDLLGIPIEEHREAGLRSSAERPRSLTEVPGSQLAHVSPILEAFATQRETYRDIVLLPDDAAEEEGEHLYERHEAARKLIVCTTARTPAEHAAKLRTALQGLHEDGQDALLLYEHRDLMKPELRSAKQLTNGDPLTNMIYETIVGLEARP